MLLILISPQYNKAGGGIDAKALSGTLDDRFIDGFLTYHIHVL
jgi:hypothetical protein